MTEIAESHSESFMDRLRRFVESSLVQRFIVAVIIINAVTLGLETSPTAMEAAGPFLVMLDRAALAVFVIELLLKMVVYRLSFFRSGWNVFDFVIVGIALLPASGNLSVLRSLRILRALRLFSMVPSMRRVVAALLGALPGIGSIGLVLMLIFYVAAVLATKLFGATHPDWFGSIGASMYTLFQIMTLESWSMGIVRPVMEMHEQAWLFFVPFILITTFAVVNLVIAVIVESMQALTTAEREHAEEKMAKVTEAEARTIGNEISALRSEIAELRKGLGGPGAPPPG